MVNDEFIHSETTNKASAVLRRAASEGLLSRDKVRKNSSFEYAPLNFDWDAYIAEYDNAMAEKAQARLARLQEVQEPQPRHSEHHDTTQEKAIFKDSPEDLSEASTSSSDSSDGFATGCAIALIVAVALFIAFILSSVPGIGYIFFIVVVLFLLFFV